MPDSPAPASPAPTPRNDPHSAVKCGECGQVGHDWTAHKPASDAPAPPRECIGFVIENSERVPCPRPAAEGFAWCWNHRIANATSRAASPAQEATPPREPAPFCGECVCRLVAVGPTRPDCFWCPNERCPEYHVWRYLAAPTPEATAPEPLPSNVWWWREWKPCKCGVSHDCAPEHVHTLEATVAALTAERGARETQQQDQNHLAETKKNQQQEPNLKGEG